MRTEFTPLFPDPDQAQEWARSELSRPVYAEGPSLWEAIITWITDLIEKIIDAGDGLGSIFMPLMVFALIVAVIVAAVVLGGPARRRRKPVVATGGMWDGQDSRTADQLRRVADAAAETGDYREAVIWRFRALVRALEERGLLRDSVGLTALEVAHTAGDVFPDHDTTLIQTADLFNAVVYGDLTPTAAQDAELAAFDRELRSARQHRDSGERELQELAP